MIPLILMAIGTAQAEMELCDCINSPRDTEAKVAECSAIFDSLNPETSREQRTACRKKPPPAGGPDICYCLTASYRNRPDVMEKREAIIEDQTESQLMKHMRSCTRGSF